MFGKNMMYVTKKHLSSLQESQNFIGFPVVWYIRVERALGKEHSSQLLGRAPNSGLWGGRCGRGFPRMGGDPKSRPHPPPGAWCRGSSQETGAEPRGGAPGDSQAWEGQQPGDGSRASRRGYG